MSNESGLYLLRPFNSIPVSDTVGWLGRVVATYSDPRDKYTPNLQCKLQLEKDIDYDEDGGFRNVAEILQHASTSAGRANICDMFGLCFERMESSAHHVESPRVWHLKLHNAERILNERVLASPITAGSGSGDSVSGQIAREVGEFRKAWMIVGFLLCENAAYGGINDRGRAISGHLDPVKIAETCIAPVAGPAAACAPLEGLSLDLQGEGTSNNHSETRTDMEGKRVFAIEYREVHVTAWWQFWRKVTAKLGKRPPGLYLFVDSESDDDTLVDEEPVMLDDRPGGVWEETAKDPDLITLTPF